MKRVCGVCAGHIPNREGLFRRWFVAAFLLVFILAEGRAGAEERIADQVAVAVLENKVYGVTPGEGLVRTDLSAGERVVGAESRGLNAFVQTSARLLAFSGKVRRWEGVRLDLSDRFIEARVSPRMIFVRTQKQLFGFQAAAGRWRGEALDTQEVFREVYAGENVVVAATDRRLLGFSAFIGGFFAIDLAGDEPITESTINDNIAIFTTPNRKLIFRSQVASWAEVR